MLQSLLTVILSIVCVAAFVVSTATLIVLAFRMKAQGMERMYGNIDWAMQHDRKLLHTSETQSRWKLNGVGMLAGSVVFGVVFFLLRASNPSDNLLHFGLSFVLGFVGYLMGYGILLNALFARARKTGDETHGKGRDGPDERAPR